MTSATEDSKAQKDAGIFILKKHIQDLEVKYRGEETNTLLKENVKLLWRKHEKKNNLKEGKQTISRFLASTSMPIPDQEAKSMSQIGNGSACHNSFQCHRLRKIVS